MNGLFSTPRPEPSHLLPAAGGALVLALALPVFVVASLPFTGWALAAVLFAVVHGLDVFLARARTKNLSVASSGVQAFGLFFKSIGLLAVLIAALAADPHVAVAAVVTYALAYTFELGLSLVFYFGSAAR